MISFYGKFLVYIEKESFDREKEVHPIRFINLDYFKSSLGNAPLPVFTLPLKTKEPIVKSSIKNGKLSLNDFSLTHDALNIISILNQVQFNISVAVSDPLTHSRAENMIKELVYFFNKSLENQDEMMKTQLNHILGTDEEIQYLLNNQQKNFYDKSAIFTNQMTLTQSTPEDKNLSEKQKKVISFFKDEERYREKILETNKSIQVSRKLATRLNLLLANLTSPPPLGQLTLLKSLAMLAGGIYKNDSYMRNQGGNQIKNHPFFKFTKFGSYTLAAAIVGNNLPEPYTFHIYQCLDLINLMSGQLQSYLEHVDYGRNFAELLSSSTKNVFNGIPNIPNAYFGEKLPKFIIGTTSIVIIPFIVFGVPHIIINGTKALRFIKENWKESSLQRGQSILTHFKNLFIEYENQEKEKYEKIIAEAESEISGGEVHLDDEELKKLRDHILFLKKKTKEGPNFKKSTAIFFRNVSLDLGVQSDILGTCGYASHRIADFLEGTSTFQKLEKSQRIDSLGKALKNFLISYASLTNTYKRLATIWNYFFIIRSFIYFPRTWYMALIYPNYFRISITKNSQGEGHIPTQYNGGKNTRLHEWIRAYKTGPSEDLIKLRKWEKAILPLENIVYEVALNRSLVALFEYIKTPERLQDFFESTYIHKKNMDKDKILSKGVPTTGLNSLADEKLKNLTSKERSFFQAFFTKTFDLTLDETIKNLLLGIENEKDNSPFSDLINEGNVSVEKIKISTIDWIENLESEIKNFKTDKKLKNYYFKEISNIANTIIEKEQIKGWSQDVASKFSFLFERKMISHNHKLLKILSPNGYQMNRFLVFEEASKNAKSIARAVRSEVASLLVDKPIEIMTIFALYAGVTSGLFQPLHNEMFGEQSFLYMSRYLLYNGFISGTIISIMADTWMKIQTDQRVQANGGFDRVPMKSDRAKGFWRYYFKNLSNPKNKWTQNQMHYAKLVISNIPAFFATALITNMITLGRFDLDVFLASALVGAISPLLGYNLKLEQAFEISSSWIGSQIPKKWRSHPEAQNYINSEIQKQKFKFNIFYESWANVTGTIESLFEAGDTENFGKRSFLRLLFGGYTPTELATIGLRKIEEIGSFIPGLSHLTQSCEEFLTKNYDAWDKVSPR